MHTLLRRTVFLPIVVAAAALVAAPAGAASNQQIATAGVMTSKDVPAGWKSSAHDSSGDKTLEKAAAKTPGCEAYAKARKSTHGQTHAESRDYTDGANQLSNEVWVFPSTAAAKKSLLAMADSTNDECLTVLFKQELDADSTVKSSRVAISQTTDLPQLGDQSFGYAGGAEVTGTDGTTSRVLLANYLVRIGPAIISYSILGPATSTGFDTSFANAIDGAIAPTVARVEKAI